MLTHLAQHLPAPCPDQGAAPELLVLGPCRRPRGSWLFSLFWCKPAEPGTEAALKWKPQTKEPPELQDNFHPRGEGLSNLGQRNPNSFVSDAQTLWGALSPCTEQGSQQHLPLSCWRGARVKLDSPSSSAGNSTWKAPSLLLAQRQASAGTSANHAPASSRSFVRPQSSVSPSYGICLKHWDMAELGTCPAAASPHAWPPAAWPPASLCTQGLEEREQCF